MPNRVTELTPMEILTWTKTDHKYILCCNVWGCPVFVLRVKLQEGHKIPKWNGCLRLGNFLGFPDNHYSLVSNVQNLTTGYISPQYHLAFDYFSRQSVGLGKMKWSLIVFSINVFSTIEIVILRNILDKMVNWYILPRLWMTFGWVTLNTIPEQINW